MMKVDQAPELVNLSSINDDSRARKSNNNGSICGVCGKKFGSKKALGVHSRAHLDLQKRPSKIIGNDDSETGDRKIDPTCTLCGKRFWSLRSLCGHLRCHPERERRGMPPEELMKGDGGGEIRSSSSDGTELDDDAYGAACALMLIATGEERYKPTPKDKKDQEALNSKKRKRNVVFIKLSDVSKICGKEAKRVVLDVDLNEPAPEYGDGDLPALA